MHIEGQYAIKESRHVVEVVFAYFFAAIAVTNKQANIAQGLTRVGEPWHVAAFDYAPEHETQSRSPFFRLKVVLGEVAAVGAASVTFGQRTQTAKPSRDG